MDHNIYLTIREVQSRESGQYTVTVCLREINEIQSKFNRVNLTRLQECLLKDGAIYICLTGWGSHILKFEEICWYEITDLAIKNYYVIKLSTTRATIIEKKEIDVELDWSDIDVKDYLNHENQIVNSSMKVLKNTKIKSVSLSIFKVCSNCQCVNKAEFTAGGNICWLCYERCQDVEGRLHQKVQLI